MSVITAKNRIIQVNYSAVQACMWMVYCVGISFSAVYMRYKGLSNTSLGAVQSLGMMLGFAVSSMLASVVDRRGRITIFHSIALVLSVQIAIFGLFCIVDIRGILFCILDCVLISTVTAVISLNTSLCFELRRYGLEPDYGPARATGSLGYAVLAAVMGSAVKMVGENIIPAVGLIIALTEAVAVAFSRSRIRGQDIVELSGQGGHTSRSTLEFIRDNPRFSVLLLGIVIVFFSHNVSNLFLINVATAVGGDVSTMGGINSFTAFLEIPPMFFMV